MKFTSFNFIEFYYKVIILIVILFFTVLGIYIISSVNYEYINLYYFLISNLYALFLFILSLFNSYMKQGENSKYYERKIAYLNLSKIINIIDLSKKQKKEKLYLHILGSQALRGKSNKSNKLPQGFKSYVIEKGFIFNNKKLKIEDKVFETEKLLFENINLDFEKYIKKNNLNNEFILQNELDNRLFFDSYNKYLDGYNLNLVEYEKILDFLISLKKKYYLKILKYKFLRIIYIIKYDLYREKAKSDIKKIRRIYGDRLGNDLNQDCNFEKISKNIEKLMESTSLVIDDLYDMQNSIKNIEDEVYGDD